MLKDNIVITDKRAIARSYAKINLTLDVLGKRDDGYHNIETIMQTLSLFDLVIVDRTHFGINVSTNLRFLPNNDKNIAYAAAREFFKHTGIWGGCKIMIHKNIPVAAGMAGGSGNAAAVLCALNLLYDTRLDTETLCDIGLKLGADVPYCIIGGTAFASGIGENITPLRPMPECPILIVKPRISVSTATVYKAIDSLQTAPSHSTEAMINAIETGDMYAISSSLSNDLGTVTEKLYPIVQGIKKKMLMNGALGSLMSGSGPTVFGIFPDFETAKRSHDSFAYQFKDVFITNTVT